MAKRKGKSQHRLNWQQRFFSGEDTQQHFSHRARLTQRSVKLPVDRELENVDELPKVQGIVTGLFPGGAIIDADGREYLCGIAKTFRAPEGAEHCTALTVGDLVTMAITRPQHASQSLALEKDRSDGMILLREPRKSALSRPQPRSLKRRDHYETEIFEKVIVANMDVLLVVMAVRQPPLRPALVDRFLIIAERGRLQPVLVINKIDIAAPEPALLADLSSRGAPLFQVSASTGEHLDALRQMLAGKQSVMAGPSGVGKSTLVNALIPAAGALTNTVRQKDERGRHTTAAASIYQLPNGGTLVDTPGVRELGLHLEPAELPWYFPEFDEYSPQCHFNDCTHTHEPDCAVQRAVEEGKLEAHRYQGYLRLLDTLEQDF